MPLRAGWSGGLKVLVGNGCIMMSAVMASAGQCAWVWQALMPLWFDNHHLLHVILFQLSVDIVWRLSTAFSSEWMCTAAGVQLHTHEYLIRCETECLEMQ